MPALATTVTATSTTEIKLSPAVKRKLLTNLKAYAELKAQRDAIEHAMDDHKRVIGELRESTGEQSLSLDGFKVTQVTSVRSTLDPKKLIAQGVTTAQIEAATVTKPGKPYEKVTCPGEKTRVED